MCNQRLQLLQQTSFLVLVNQIFEIRQQLGFPSYFSLCVARRFINSLQQLSKAFKEAVFSCGTCIFPSPSHMWFSRNILRSILLMLTANCEVKTTLGRQKAIHTRQRLTQICKNLSPGTVHVLLHRLSAHRIVKTKHGRCTTRITRQKLSGRCKSLSPRPVKLTLPPPCDSKSSFANP